MSYLKSTGIIAAGFLVIAFSAQAVENVPQAFITFEPVVEQTVGGNYVERITIRNGGVLTLNAGTLEVKFPTQLRLAASTPAASYNTSSNFATWAVPTLAPGATFSVVVTVTASGPGNFIISEASYIVNGIRMGFMAAPNNVSATGEITGVLGTDVGGTGESAGDETTLPRTGMTSNVMYLVLAVLSAPWVFAQGKKNW